ncbi:MAG TPA: hypothetical protein VGM19_08515 [Armatimonadota bacterium]|jgi:MraZ protein
MSAPGGAKPHKLDATGRLKLREEERDALGDVAVLSCGFDNCVSIFTPDRWDKFVADFDKLASQDPDAHDLRRLLVANAEQCEIDAQGRLRVPEFLMRWAELGGESKLQAYLIKVGEGWWECWEATRYQEFLTLRAQQLKQVAGGYWRTGVEPVEEAK